MRNSVAKRLRGATNGRVHYRTLKGMRHDRYGRPARMPRMDNKQPAPDTSNEAQARREKAFLGHRTSRNRTQPVRTPAPQYQRPLVAVFVALMRHELKDLAMKVYRARNAFGALSKAELQRMADRAGRGNFDDVRARLGAVRG